MKTQLYINGEVRDIEVQAKTLKEIKELVAKFGGVVSNSLEYDGITRLVKGIKFGNESLYNYAVVRKRKYRKYGFYLKISLDKYANFNTKDFPIDEVYVRKGVDYIMLTDLQRKRRGL